MVKRPRPSVGSQLDELVGGGGLEHLVNAPRVAQTVPLNQLRALSTQPRRHFDDVTLADLAQSIREQGLLQPLLVRPAGNGFEIVAGERRYRAAKLAGLNEVSVLVRDLTDEEARTLALVENLQREDLNPVDRADAIAHLIARALDIPPERVPAQLSALRKHPEREDHAPLIALVEGVFSIVGGSWRSFLVHLLPVLRYPEDVLELVRSGQLEYTKAAVIARIGDIKERGRLLKLASKGASLEELRAAARSQPGVSSAPTQARLVARSLHDWSRVERLPLEQQARIGVLLEELQALLGAAPRRNATSPEMPSTKSAGSGRPPRTSPRS
ncbi:ParB/RepB/Spo0J family partition protein [Deinococcus alpinitundrae]|uniref:ParB/RepB/Spo0J family partition protein n=1 Tax=Deinococcus alpinitundrae TaxID=468913 RepID=UPI00137A3B62|nr:ParB/RepB/Spo0J family partition protein [Deinococcus alpinitundrae]